ncbi:MAG: hemerythrin domain-containing protein, partial [Thermodesulfobacteriota bacterium]
MDFIEWNDNFSVNVEELDKQHREMIGIINRLLDSIADEKNDEIVDDILNKLTDFIMTHFETEEHYFDKFNYSK